MCFSYQVHGRHVIYLSDIRAKPVMIQYYDLFTEGKLYFTGKSNGEIRMAGIFYLPINTYQKLSKENLAFSFQMNKMLLELTNFTY